MTIHAVSEHPEGVDLELSRLLSSSSSLGAAALEERVKELFQKGAKVWNPPASANAPGPLDYVIGKPSVVQLLLDNGGVPTQSTLRAALSVEVPQRYPAELIQRLIDAKATVAQDGRYLRHVINRGYPVDMLRVLIKAGEPVTEKHLACAKQVQQHADMRYSDPAVLAFLEQELAAPVQEEFRQALLTGKDNHELERLLYLKAKPEQPDPLTKARGDLERAVCNYPNKSSYEVIRLLIEHGAKPTPPREEETGTLANALVRKCPEDIIRSLVDVGARLGSRAYLDVAREHRYSAATLELLESVAPAASNPGPEEAPQFYVLPDPAPVGFFETIASCLEGLCNCICNVCRGIARLFSGLSAPDDSDSNEEL